MKFSHQRKSSLGGQQVWLPWVFFGVTQPTCWIHRKRCYADFKIRSEFLELFAPEDERLDAFVFEYVNQDGNTVTLGEDNVRSFKYPEDLNGVGDVSGNDFPLLRYADILLARAEALNELNGPNPESITPIPQSEMDKNSNLEQNEGYVK